MNVDYKGTIKGLVSVVTPVYNGEAYLYRLLDSILEQTYPFIEMIVADDGSTDRTLLAAESYREKFEAKGYGYRIVHAEHNCAAAAINLGLPYVAGEYLIWPDGDDRLEPDSVGKRVGFLQKHPEYQCVRSLSYYFDEKTGEECKADEQSGDLSKEELFWDILESKTFVCCGCYMLRTERFFEIYRERHIPEYPVGQNFQMLLPFMYYHRCPTIREKLYGVCVREGSHSRRTLTREEEEKKFRHYEEMIDEIAKLCKINDRASVKHIRYWKMKRRYWLARKYNQKWKMAGALCHLFVCGNDGRRMAKEYGYSSAKIFIVRKKTWVYWRIRILCGKCYAILCRARSKLLFWIKK